MTALGKITVVDVGVETRKTLVEELTAQRTLAILGAAAGAVAVGALVCGATAGRWSASPRQRRLIDMFESLLLVSVAPLVLGVWNLYSTVFHLHG